MKKVIILFIFFCLIITGCDKKEKLVEEINDIKEIEETGYIIDTIEIKNIDGSRYEFFYNNETYQVLYISDTWKVYNSYKITNSKDMKKICEALINIHKIPSSDYKSYRTVDDLVYEWKQHNLAYMILPESNSFRNSAKDVDLDPRDQGKSLVEIYEDRTGQKLDISKYFN